MELKEFSILYQQLPGNRRSLFRLLSLHPGDDATVHSTAALIGLTEAETAQILDDLLDVKLVTRTSDRYRMPDPIRGYAKTTQKSKTRSKRGNQR